MKIHGELEPLLDLSLKPVTNVKVHICFEKQLLEEELNVYQTTWELKVRKKNFFTILQFALGFICWLCYCVCRTIWKHY